MSSEKSNKRKINRALADSIDYIDPKYPAPEQFSVICVRGEFNKFCNKMIKDVTNSETDAPKNPYAFNTHFGQFKRALDNAKDEYIKALFAFHCEVKKTEEEEDE
jgi:hypothetical protein